MIDGLRNTTDKEKEDEEGEATEWYKKGMQEGDWGMMEEMERKEELQNGGRAGRMKGWKEWRT